MQIISLGLNYEFEEFLKTKFRNCDIIIIDDIEEIVKYKNHSLLIGNILNLSKNEFIYTLDLNSKIIAVLTNSSEKELVMEAKSKGINIFIQSNADFIEIEGIIELVIQKKEDEKSLKNCPLNMLSTPVFIKDLQSNFIDCNEAFCEYFGNKKDEIVGKKSSDFSSNKKAQIYEEFDKLIIETGKSFSYEGKSTYTNETINTIKIHKSPFYLPDGKIGGVIGVITDISDRKQKEKELLEAKKKAEESDKLKSSFLSNMSHEIRTPMNAIVGFSQLLSTPGINDEKKQIYIDQVNINAELLLKLIEDIIEISKIEAGKVKVTIAPCPVNKLLDELKTTFETHKARQGKNHIELKLKKANNATQFVLNTDTFRLSQILTNLIGNSIKFTEEGIVEFGYKIIENNNFLEFYVKDTGLGINKEKMEYVFDRFSKIPASKTKLYGGTGLGLSISKSLVDLLGGTISVESEENVGSCFKFTIPFVSESINNQEEPAIIEPTRIKQYFWLGRTILIAEDEEMNYLYLQEVLRNTKVEIIWKQTGKDAVFELQKNNDIDLILMDIQMPQMDGYEATKIIRKQFPDIPIIIQTAYAMPSERKKGFDAGCNEYLEKPINHKELLSIIEKYLT